jgi:hypothetical protein
MNYEKIEKSNDLELPILWEIKELPNTSFYTIIRM